MITLTTSSVVALSIGAPVALDVRRERAAAVTELTERAELLASHMGDMAAEPLRAEDVPALRNVVHMMASLPDVGHVRLVGTDGRVLVASDGHDQSMDMQSMDAHGDDAASHPRATGEGEVTPAPASAARALDRGETVVLLRDGHVSIASPVVTAGGLVGVAQLDRLQIVSRKVYFKHGQIGVRVRAKHFRFYVCAVWKQHSDGVRPCDYVVVRDYSAIGVPDETGAGSLRSQAVVGSGERVAERRIIRSAFREDDYLDGRIKNVLIDVGDDPFFGLDNLFGRQRIDDLYCGWWPVAHDFGSDGVRAGEHRRRVGVGLHGACWLSVNWGAGDDRV